MNPIITALRKDMLLTKHACARIPLPKEWTTKDLPYSLAERKAYAIKMIFEQMPLYIGEHELIVGTRTIYGKTDETWKSQSCYDYNAMPSYVNQADIAYFGFNHEFVSKAHYTPDYSIVLNIGINGLLKKLDDQIEKYQLEDQIQFAKSVKIVYSGLQILIKRYANYALELAEKASENRKKELNEIAEVCNNISENPASNIREACQMFWFLYLGTIIENFQFVNFGRIDQMLFSFVKKETIEELTELTGSLLLKMYDQYDLILVDKNLMGKYSAQHNITIGGVKRDGTNGCNIVTKAILLALHQTRLPEPLVSVRVNKTAPDWFLKLASELTVSGMNCMAYYHDEQVIDSLNHAGIQLEDARDYGFGLCQDILIPGRGDHYCSGGVNLTVVFLATLRELKDKELTYQQFFDSYKQNVIREVDHNLQAYNYWENAILQYNNGNKTCFFDSMKQGLFSPDEPALGITSAQAARNEQDQSGSTELYIQSLMSPLPFTSAMYHGCIDNGIDLTRCGCKNKDKGVMILSPVIAFNGLAALKKVVFQDKRCKLKDVANALDQNFEGYEVLRQYLWNAPKWCNDDDFVDQDAVELIHITAKEIQKFKTPYGGRHLSGIHQPHPVFAGRTMPATPEGRFAGTPIPVTISPENGTLKDGPAGAMKSAAKINSRDLQWNSCLMLQYYSSTFGENDGAQKFAKLLKAYFKLGGVQHQPNVVDVDKLKDAQIHPENYKDLIIRMWGVSAHFVDLPKDVQDEFIARFN